AWRSPSLLKKPNLRCQLIAASHRSSFMRGYALHLLRKVLALVEQSSPYSGCQGVSLTNEPIPAGIGFCMPDELPVFRTCAGITLFARLGALLLSKIYF
ncbi:MAG: hypothetical protein ABIG45_06635, partial [Bacillota bacterium]